LLRDHVCSIGVWPAAPAAVQLSRETAMEGKVMVWIAQISDPHLRPRGELYQGVVDSNAALARAVEQLNRLSPQPDVVVLTGDVVDEGLPAEYAMAREILDGLKAPLLVIPGNHDEREAFRTAFRDHPYLPAEGPLHYVADAGAARIIALDITVPGDHHGLFDEAAETWLALVLQAEPARPTVLIMHQPPIVTGVPYLDEYRCFGKTRMQALIARHPQVARILCGHVHRLMLQSFAGTMLCTAPSLATAIALRMGAKAQPASFLEPPGFFLHNMPDDGPVLTHFIPLGDFAGPFDFA
jgi:Icc protein